jgi:glycosyltransferase involved in cell wall biosynthesis
MSAVPAVDTSRQAHPPAADAYEPRGAALADVASKPLDTLFVLNSLGMGGSERKVLRLVDRLWDAGVRSAVACLNEPFTLEPFLRRDVRLFKLGRRGKFSLSAIWRLRKLIIEHRPASVLSVNLYPAIYVWLAAALAPGPRPRTIGLVNTSTASQSTLKLTLYRALLPRLDSTVQGSQAQRTVWFSPNSSAWRRSKVIYNGVDVAHFRPGEATEQAQLLRAQAGIPPQRFVIGTVGRLAPEKNQEVLLRSLATLRASSVDAHLLLVGGGRLKERLAQLAAGLGVAKRTTFLDSVDDVRPALAAMDVFVLPSSMVECFSNAALEAMAMGKAVILSDVGGAREMISDGGEGFIVAPRELDARLPPMLAALCADTRRRARLGEAARRRVERMFSQESMVASYRDLLRPGAEQVLRSGAAELLRPGAEEESNV